MSCVEDFFLDKIAPVLMLLLVAAVFGVALFGAQLWARDFLRGAPSAPTPAAPVPHVASDCRAACTLEGMELAGVELTPSQYASATATTVRCLCAPVSGGDL